jgi:ligand-binding sensor domain-containing protein
MNGPFTALLLLLLPVLLTAQEYRLKNYTTKDGLSSNSITATIKDRDGFLWIATTNGLNRFDGNAFDVFYNRPGDRQSLASNQVQALCIDGQQRLWAGSVGGISLYHPQQQNFSNYYPDSSNGKCGRWFCALAAADDGQLWVGTWYELLIFDPATKKFQRSGWANFAATHKPANGNNSRVVILSLQRKGPHELWVLTTYGLYSVHTQTMQFTWHPNNYIEDYFGCQISHIDADSNLWIGTFNKGIVRYDAKRSAWSHYLPPDSWLTARNYYRCYGITPFGGDTMLYAAVDGLAFFSMRQSSFIGRWKESPGEVFRIYPSDGGYWLIGNSGFTRMQPQQNPYKTITPFGPANYINKVYALQQNPDWLVLDATEKFQTGLWHTSTRQFKPFVTATGGTTGGELSGWLQLNDSTAIITSEEAVFTVNLRTLLAKPVPLPKKIWPENKYVARNVVRDAEGMVWVRLRSQGIARYDPATGKTGFINFITPSQDRAYSALYYNPVQQCLWVAVEHEGLFQYSLQSKKVTYHRLPDHNSDAAADISCITGDAAGNMYMTDVTRGLYYYQQSTGHFTLYGSQSGLPSTSCNFVALDADGLPWVSTTGGLCRFNVHTGLATVFESMRELPPSLPFLYTAADGNMYAGANYSYYQWQPRQLPQQPDGGKLYLRSVYINNQPVAAADNYRLPYSDNNIRLQAGIISTTPEETVDFEYALNDTSNWLAVENSHTLNFSNLSAGRYRIYFRRKGVPGAMQVSVYIVPPWWQRPVFWVCLAALTAAAAFVLVRRRITHIRRQAHLKQKMAETEMMALRAQMNPHFIFNCISSIDNFIQDNDKDNASAWLGRFAKLIRNILDNSRHEVVPFWKDWETLRLYTELEQLRAGGVFACVMEADEALLNGHYRLPPLIIQPYVENAIHHGLLHRRNAGGMLTITARLREQQLAFVIEDNGIGREKAAALKVFNTATHSSYGMQLSGERVRLFNNQPGQVVITDLKDATGNAAGTRVTIYLAV